GLLLIKSDTIILSNEIPSDIEQNAIKGKITEIIPSEFGIEVTIDAGDLFFVNVHSSNIEELNLFEKKEVWISFPSKAIVLLSGTS
ncbi:MAG TPA: hypothetical protein VF346_03450, partial [Bacteroidales bacterium]